LPGGEKFILAENPGRISKVPEGKRPAGAGFQVLLEGQRLVAFRETEDILQSPGRVFGGVGGFAVVVLGEAGLGVSE
jgi:hypothetical protein